MCNICTFFAILLGGLVLRSPVSAHLSDILKLCDYVGCDAASEDPMHQLDRRPDADYRFLMGGLSQIFWDDVRSGDFMEQNSDLLSQECKTQLNLIARGIQESRSLAYSFVDASGKAPPGILRATMTAVGDYDQCLGIEDSSSGVSGRYCMIDVFALRNESTSNQSHSTRVKAGDQQVDLSRVSVFSGFPFWSALCLPSGCEAREMQPAIARLMLPYAFKVAGDFSCDTRHEVSWSHRITHMTGKQVVAAQIVAGLLGFVLLCTVADVYQRCCDLGLLSPAAPRLPSLPPIVRSVSAFESSVNLLFSKPMKYEVAVFELVKIFIIVPVRVSRRRQAS